MNKKPKVFQNHINKTINNNRTYEVTNHNEVVKENIDDKIKNIFNSRNYIYKANVTIKTISDTINCQIIGKKGNNLLTIDNQLIPISDIIDIQRKN